MTNTEIKENKELLERVKSLIPEVAGVTDVEFEGPDIAVYVKNVAQVYNDENIIKNISSSIKKRIIVRATQSSLSNEEEALKKILAIIPPEAGVNEERIRFDKEFSQVYILFSCKTSESNDVAEVGVIDFDSFIL